VRTLTHKLDAVEPIPFNPGEKLLNRYGFTPIEKSPTGLRYAEQASPKPPITYLPPYGFKADVLSGLS